MPDDILDYCYQSDRTDVGRGEDHQVEPEMAQRMPEAEARHREILRHRWIVRNLVDDWRILHR